MLKKNYPFKEKKLIREREIERIVIKKIYMNIEKY
jgi:hypothetical protein